MLTHTMPRRDFLALAAAVIDVGKIPTRKVGKVETVFKSPGPKPNGLQATKDGLWIMDQGDGNRVYLVAYEGGKVLREFGTDADRASGITFDGEALWLASTYGRELIRADAQTGKTLQRYFTPGAGVIYRMKGMSRDAAVRWPSGSRRRRRKRPGGKVRAWADSSKAR